jgi:peptidyl-tRNA hydrolase, PTH1 family
LAVQRLIVGLGNPGKTYEKTRHNLGFMTLQEMSRRFSFSWKNSSLYRAAIASGKIGDQAVCLFLPQTMMNLSGVAVKKIITAREMDPADILVVCDDLNLEFGQMRLRPQGSDGGHNGLKSLIAALGTKEFGRLRMGIGRPPLGKDPADYVLESFSRHDLVIVEGCIQAAVDCCAAWVKEGMESVMNVFNKRKGNE